MMPVNPDGIPNALKATPHWVLWKLEKGNKRKNGTYGKDKKVPYSFNGSHAKSNDSNTWNTFDTVYAEYLKGKYSGIGFVFTDTDLCAVDVDYLINHQKSQEIIDLLSGTYCEESPSGKLHGFCIGKAQRTGKGTDDKLFEIYDKTSPRYMTVTGHHIEGTASDLTEQQAQLDTLHEMYFKVKPPQVKQVQPTTTVDINLDDTRIIEIAGKAKNQDKFNALYYGNGLTTDESSNDLSLCNLLAFYTKDSCQIDRIFRNSMRMRDKWNEAHYSGGETYGQHTINKAITGCTGSYRSKPPDILSIVPKVTNPVSAMSMQELMAAEFPPVNWVIGDLLPSGRTILSGKPKKGKSWVALIMCIFIACGRPVFGREVKKGKTLYLGLEDSFQRIQSRSKVIFEKFSINPDDARDFYCNIEIPRLEAGFEEHINEWMTKHPDTVLMVVDVLVRVRAAADRNKSPYENDYAVGQALQPITVKWPSLAILVIHHSRKGESDDSVDAHSGTLGLIGSFDNGFTIKDDGNMRFLTVDGRDIESGDDIPLLLDESGFYTFKADNSVGKSVHTSQTRERVFNAIPPLGGNISRKHIIEYTELSGADVDQQLKFLVSGGNIEKVDRGQYKRKQAANF